MCQNQVKWWCNVFFSINGGVMYFLVLQIK